MPTTQLLLCCALIWVRNIISAYAGLPSSPWPTIHGDGEDKCLSIALVASFVCIQLFKLHKYVYAHSVFCYVCNTHYVYTIYRNGGEVMTTC